MASFCTGCSQKNWHAAKPNSKFFVALMSRLKSTQGVSINFNGTGRRSHWWPKMPFGKHFGKTINDVMEEDPSYLVWFAKNIKNMPDFVEQIKSHSQFSNAWADYMGRERGTAV